MAFFYVLEDGVYVPTTELAQSYAALNFKQVNSLGIGTTSIIPTSNPDNPNWIADISSRDFWGFTEDDEENLYRLTKVGVGTDSPQYQLDISGTLNATGSTTLGSELDVTGITTFKNYVGFETNIRDSNFGSPDFDNELGLGKTDYRLASYPGIGVSWRPPGVETENTIWVTLDGDDNNTGLLEGDAKRTVGAAAEIAQSGDTIFIRAGEYTENNPIGLRSDVTVTGQDIRLVKLIPANLGQDFFHVRRGCLIENLSFTCEPDGLGGFQDNPGGAAVAFPPRFPSKIAVSGFIELGPTSEGATRRWRSPYIRNCTNFMPKSIGMKIDGDDATATVVGGGADLKSMVCDSFTQYNEAGIGVSITNNGYAQLVSIFTINSDIGIYCDTGGSCDLTNSNTSFGNFGLYAVGLGRTEFTGITTVATSDETDRVRVNITTLDPISGKAKRPYDGQALFFKIDNPNTGIPLTDPLVLVQSVTITNSDGYGSPGQYSPSAPPSVGIIDTGTNQPLPQGPEGIIAEFSPTVDEFTGKITSIDVVNSGRNYLPEQAARLRVQINGTTISDSDIQVNTDPIYYTVSESTEPDVNGNCIITFNEFIPYLIDANVEFDLKRISRILTSSHSFEYVGSGTSINTVTPLQGAVPIKENEIVQLAGAQIPFTSTDQKGNFDIGEGFQINQPTSTIRGRAFSKAIQAELTPLILALGR
jgi:hypothetical protein